MNDHLPAISLESEALSRRLELLNREFLDLFTLHREMVDNDAAILTSVYLEKLGHLQLELLEKQTALARIRMKMKLIQAAINRDERPDITAIEIELNNRLSEYYAHIEAQAAALEEARKVLLNLISEEETQKLRELFRILCKRLHPDLNPDQSEEELELFIRVKAAYDLQRLEELQEILLYLDRPGEKELPPLTQNEKQERITRLEERISSLHQIIDQLNHSFPFNIKEQLYDDDYIAGRRSELRNQIDEVEKEIVRYANYITVMTDE